MKLEHNTITCEEIRGWDMVNYLSKMGYEPQKIRGGDYWYFSPLREERTASFKIFRKANIWYDHGAGQGGNLVDFLLTYFQCSIPELLNKLSTEYLVQPVPVRNTPERNMDNPDQSIKIEQVGAILSAPLKHYLRSRNIPLIIAQQYCKEVSFSMHRKTYDALGLENRSGGFELRNAWFKGSNSPKDITLIQQDLGKLTVLEGLFDFLSYQTALQKELPTSDFLILNSLSFIQRAIPILQQYPVVDLYLDQGRAGQQQTQLLLSQFPKCTDQSTLYQQFDDLNAWHCSTQNNVYQHKQLGKGL